MPTMIEWFTLNYELDGEPESVGKFPSAPEKPKRDVYYLEDDEWGEGSK